MLRIAAGTLTATIGTGVVAVRETVGSENFDRSMSFYAVAIPGYCNYRYMDLRTRNIPQAERDKKFEKLHKVWAPAALEKILELRGFYIKVGQMAATNIGNAFPDKWVRTMEVLQDNVPPRDINTVRKIIETEYGCSVDELFESIEHKPVGAASIGQVHRAVLRQGTTLEAMLRKKSNGSTVDSDLQDASARKAEERPPRNVVVKVQYPEVESFFRGDVQTIKWFCKVAQPEHVKALEEIEKQFMTEFDYREEGKNLDSVRRNLAKPFPGVVIPRPWLSLCTKYLLVMEDLSPATKLADALRADAGKVAMLQARLSGGDGGDGAGGGVRGQATRGDDVPLPKVGADADEAERGMSAEAMDAILARAAAAIRVSNAAARAHNRAVGWLRWVPVLGSRLAKRWPLKPEIQPRDALPLNHARVVDDLLIVHGHQILIDGCFNGDPHPGNVRQGKRGRSWKEI
jgi:aarF domain-containing kinase